MKTSTLIVKLKNLIKDYPDTDEEIKIKISTVSNIKSEITVSGTKQELLEHIDFDLKRLIVDCNLFSFTPKLETPAYLVQFMFDDLTRQIYLVSDTDLLNSKDLLNGEEITSHILGVLNDNAGLKDCYVSIEAIMADGTSQEFVDDYDAIYKDLQFEEKEDPSIGIVWNESKSILIKLLTASPTGKAMFRTLILTFSDDLDSDEGATYYKQYTLKPNAKLEGFVLVP